MAAEKKEILKLFDILMSTVKRLNEDQFNKVLSGDAWFKYTEVKAKDVCKKAVLEKAPEGISIESAAAALEKFNTRGEAEAYLNGLKLKKEQLLSLGRLVVANIYSKDTKAAMLEKIIEATVGGKLRSEAIEKINLKRLKKE